MVCFVSDDKFARHRYLAMPNILSFFSKNQHATRSPTNNYNNMNHNVEAHLLYEIPTGFLREESPPDGFHHRCWNSRTVEELVASIAEKRC